MGKLLGFGMPSNTLQLIPLPHIPFIARTQSHLVGRVRIYLRIATKHCYLKELLPTPGLSSNAGITCGMRHTVRPSSHLRHFHPKSMRGVAYGYLGDGNSSSSASSVAPSGRASPAAPRQRLSHWDIGLNLTSVQFTQGVYHDRPKHSGDVAQVLQRAALSGVSGCLITGTDPAESRAAVNLVLDIRVQNGMPLSEALTEALAVPTSGPAPVTEAAQRPELKPTHWKFPRLLATAGIHPTEAAACASNSHQLSQSIQAIRDLIQEDIARYRVTGTRCIAALGEMGLDYDRLHFAPRDVQLVCFETQLKCLCPMTYPPHVPPPLLLLQGRHAAPGGHLADAPLEEARACAPSGNRLPIFFHLRNADADFIALVRKHRGMFERGGMCPPCFSLPALLTWR
jgi:Tat protein secretion system quality control protein TatD with DNase activity